MNKPFSIIVAVDQLGGFAKQGKIPWYFKEDFKHFKTLTEKNICIMGRTTYDDIRSRNLMTNKVVIDQETGEYKTEMVFDQVLPYRENYVVTSNPNTVDGATAISSLWDIEKYIDYDDTRKIFVIGGERLFQEALSATDEVFLTVINNDYQCDKLFNMKYLTEHFVIKEKYTDERRNISKSNKPFIFIDWVRIKK